MADHDHELNANDTEPPWEGHMDYFDAPALINGQPNPDLPPFTGTEVMTFVMVRVDATGNPVTGAVPIEGPLTVVNATTRHVRHVFSKAETVTPGEYHFTAQIDYGDGRRHTHPLGAPSTLKIWPDLGGPA